MGSYKKLEKGEVWCEYCDEYKVPENETKDFLIKEFLEDLNKLSKMTASTTDLAVITPYIKKWEKRSEKEWNMKIIVKDVLD